MKWVTRAGARVDRIACPWLIARFVDPAAEFVFVPADQVLEVAAREGAIPAGLYALASGFRKIARDDHENLRLQFPAYDALYSFCGEGAARTG